MLAPWAKLQAVLQGILQGAGPVGCYYKVIKVLTGRVIEREVQGVLLNASLGRAGPRFRHFVPGSSFLISLCLAFLFLGSLPWALEVLRALDGLH